MDIYKQKSQQNFDRQAAEYDNNYCGQHARKLYPFILEQVRLFQPTNILDLGCGTAELIIQILQRYDDAKLHGIDLSKGMLAVAEQKLQGQAELVHGDSQYLPYSDESMDMIICNDSFHHYPQPSAVISEIHRVLKPQGVLVIGDCYQPLLTRWIMNFYMKFSNDGDVKIYSKKEFVSMLSEHFTKIHWVKVNAVSCIVAAIKD